jgi:hypothetical protein
LQIGQKLGELSPTINAGGFRHAVDEKKREKLNKDIQKYKRKRLHMEKEKIRLTKKVAKEERAATRRKRRQK